MFVLRLGSCSVWSVFFESVRVTWQQRERERKPQHTQRPLLIKHLRGQFAFPGAQKLPGQKERGWREGRAGSGLQVLTEAGIVPSGDGSRG